MWYVMVSNVGQVFEGREREARKEFSHWVRDSKRSRGRSSGEDVHLFDESGGLVKEYTGRLSREERRES